ncbi:MAG: carbamate kinase [Actinomycetota bacterium]|nr:carbamate kinase [Actinomycetota bacterium]
MAQTSDAPLVVVALGGNAMQDPHGDDSVESDFARTARTADVLAAIAVAGWRLVVTHGNGPQVGNHLYRSELAYEDGGVPLLPLDVCVADTEGGMGYMLQQCLANAFTAANIPAVVVSLVTQVLVAHDDPAFDSPSKPVGEIIEEDRVLELRSRGWALVEDRRRGGWRRVVASPDPKEIVEAAAIEALVGDGVMVIAAGGGGVPVVQTGDGGLKGIAAVVDKDLASALLAIDLRADALLILTDIDSVRLRFGTPDERPLAEVSVENAREFLAAGEFAAGSMGPKVEAACRFAEATDGPGTIAAIDDALDALQGRKGTRITRT